MRRTARRMERREIEWHRRPEDGPRDPVVLPTLYGPEHTIRTTREEELEYFDRLGPLTRHALANNCAFRWSALDVLREINRRGLHAKYSKDDAAIAKDVVGLDISRRIARIAW